MLESNGGTSVVEMLQATRPPAMQQVVHYHVDECMRGKSVDTKLLPSLSACLPHISPSNGSGGKDATSEDFGQAADGIARHADRARLLGLSPGSVRNSPAASPAGFDSASRAGATSSTSTPLSKSNRLAGTVPIPPPPDDD